MTKNTPTVSEALEHGADRAERIAQIIDRNLFRQDEKVKDAQALARELASDLRSALPALSGESVTVQRVKALEWSECNSHGGRVLVGRDPNGYEVARIYYDANREAPTSPRIVAKKAAAQADFERRVLSCLSTHTAAGAGPVGEAVRTARKAVEELANTNMSLSIVDWSRISNAILAALEFAHTEGSGEAKSRWYLGAMNDGLFIIDKAPRSNSDAGPWNREDGPKMVLNVAALTHDQAKAIVDAHNSAIAAMIAACPVEEPGEVERFIDQTVLYEPGGPERGNCTEAAVASILGIPLSEVPDFRVDGTDAHKFWSAFRRFIRSRGFEPIMLLGNHCHDVLYLASGPSPRGVSHMVVMKGGKLVHDPHPSKAGIGIVESVWLLVPHDCARSVQEPSEVERIARERDEAMEREVKRAVTLRQRIDDMRCEIAEIRKHLEKLLEAAGKARTALAGFTSVDDAAFALDVAISEIKRVAGHPVEEPDEVAHASAERAETAESALVETRERLEKVEVSWVLEWTAAPRPPHPTTMTGRQTFRSQSDAVAFMRRQPSDATFVSLTEVRQTSMDQSDIVRAALTGDAQEASPMEKLGKFGWHPDPVIDFEVEIEKLESRFDCAMRGTSKPGERAETVQAVHDDIRRAMTFKAGGTVEGVVAKNRLRDLEAKAIAASAGDA